MVNEIINNLNMTMYKTPQEFKFLEIGQYEEASLYDVLDILMSDLNFQRFGRYTKDADETIIELIKEEKKVILGWDVWDGCYIMAEDTCGDECIIEIQNYFETAGDRGKTRYQYY